LWKYFEEGGYQMWYDIVNGNGDFLGRANGDTPEGAVEGVQKYWPCPEDRWLRDPSNKESQDLLIPGAKKEQELVREDVWAFCKPHIKGMLGVQTKPLNKPPQFLDGEYYYEVLGKTYCVKIVLDAVFITRIK
jgi:hypothetical protein